MTLSSRIGVMDHGRIVQVGTPKEIYEFPGNRFVAEFIGSVNLFEGQAAAEQDEDGHLCFACPELERPVHVARGAGPAPQGRIWVAIRPEKMQLSLAPPPAAANWTQGRVKEIAYLGDLSVFLVALQSGKTIRVTRPNVMRHDDQGITWEQQVYLHWHDSSPVLVSE